MTPSEARKIIREDQDGCECGMNGKCAICLAGETLAALDPISEIRQAFKDADDFLVELDAGGLCLGIWRYGECSYGSLRNWDDCLEMYSRVTEPPAPTLEQAAEAMREILTAEMWKTDSPPAKTIARFIASLSQKEEDQ